MNHSSMLKYQDKMLYMSRANTSRTIGTISGNNDVQSHVTINRERTVLENKSTESASWSAKLINGLRM